MIGTSFLTNCPRCGYIAQASTAGGIIVRVRCSMCGYRGEQLASPDLKDGLFRET